MCEPSILIAYLRYDRNSCHIDEHDESGKWYILTDSTKIDNPLYSMPEFNENCSPDGTIEVGHATHDNMDRIFKKSSKDLNHSNCQDVMRLLLKKSFLFTLQMKDLEEMNETKPLTSCQEIEN
jgi:hypothetical protein